MQKICGGKKKTIECLSHDQVNIYTLFTTLTDAGQETMSTEGYLS